MPLSHHAYYGAHSIATPAHDAPPPHRYQTTRTPTGATTLTPAPQHGRGGYTTSPAVHASHHGLGLGAGTPPSRGYGSPGLYETTRGAASTPWEVRLNGYRQQAQQHQTQTQTPKTPPQQTSSPALASLYGSPAAAGGAGYGTTTPTQRPPLTAADRAAERVEELLSERDHHRTMASSPLATRGRVASPPTTSAAMTSRVASGGRMSRSPGRDYTTPMTPPKRVFSSPPARDYERDTNATGTTAGGYGYTSSTSDATYTPNLSISSAEGAVAGGGPSTPRKQAPHLNRVGVGRDVYDSPRTPGLRDVERHTPPSAALRDSAYGVPQRHPGAAGGYTTAAPTTTSSAHLDRPKDDVNENGERRVSMLWDGMSQFIIAPQAPEDSGKYCCVLDLDETLVYAREGPIKVRPFMRELIQVLGDHFETVVWTAGERSYAKEVLRKIDPISAIRHCVYRHHLWFDGQAGQVKDLRLLGRDPDRVLLVENTPDCLRKNATQSVLLPDFRGRDEQGILQRLAQFLKDLVRSGQPVSHFLRASPLITPREVSTNVGDTIICHTIGESDSNFAHRAPNPDTLPKFKSPTKMY